MKFLQKLLSGLSDKNIRLNEMRKPLLGLGFNVELKDLERNYEQKQEEKGYESRVYSNYRTST